MILAFFLWLEIYMPLFFKLVNIRYLINFYKCSCMLEKNMYSSIVRGKILLNAFYQRSRNVQ